MKDDRTSTIEYAKKRLAEIAELTDGWEFGEGIAPSRTSLERAEQVLDFAHKVGIQEMEVFPRADGAVEVHLYNDPGTLEVTCWTDGTARLVEAINATHAKGWRYVEGWLFVSPRGIIHDHCLIACL